MFRLAARLACVSALLILATSCSKKSSPMAPVPSAVYLTTASTGPASGATDLSVTSTFRATFNTPVDVPTATTTTFKVFAGSAQVPGTVTASGYTVTFTPKMAFHTDQVYTATVTTGLKDQTGHHLASDLTWSATTEVGTSIGGIINTPTTLALANSPYAITSDIQLAYGTTMTVEPGVVIDGKGRKLTVFGNLAATGTAGARITFFDTRILPGGNLDTQPYVITLQHAIVSGGRIYDATGNAVYGSLIVRDSKLLGLQSYMYVWYPVADCYIERNVFIGCGGISVGTSNAVKVYVRNNVFLDQTDTYAVQNWATYNTSETVVALNSFLSTSQVALRLPAGYSDTHLTAINNYWGTTTTATIDAMVFDKNDDLSSNEVIVFQPILTSPDAATPDPAPWILTP